MLAPLSLIGTALDFTRKQPVLRQILFWLTGLPFFMVLVLLHLLEPKERNPWPSLTLAPGMRLLAMTIIGILLLIAAWGNVANLIVARRRIKSAAGRNRTSFSAARSEALRYLMPYMTIEILRYIPIIGLAFIAMSLPQISSLAQVIVAILFLTVILLWNTLMIFAPIALVCEERNLRSALTRSYATARQKILSLTATLLVLHVLLSILVVLPGLAMMQGLMTIDGRLLLVADGIIVLAMGLQSLLETIAVVELFARVRE